MEIGEFKDVVDPLMAPSMAVDASAAKREANVPPLALEEVAGGGATGEGIINEPTMPTFDLDPSKSRKTTGTVSVAHASIMCKDLP